LLRTLSTFVSGGNCTWAKPVIPGRTSRHNQYRGTAFSSSRKNSGRSRRGPIKLISSSRTFQNWGSSSMWSRRNNQSPSEARIIGFGPTGTRPALTIVNHGAQLVNNEQLPVTAHSGLEIKSGTHARSVCSGPQPCEKAGKHRPFPRTTATFSAHSPGLVNRLSGKESTDFRSVISIEMKSFPSRFMTCFLARLMPSGSTLKSL
jgi:hypothetical protein